MSLLKDASVIWLKAGVKKEGIWHETEIGSPQGGVISPLLVNIYLNYLDTIWEKRFSHLGKLIRYGTPMIWSFYEVSPSMEERGRV
jgi:retron-type reverse transcriptase